MLIEVAAHGHMTPEGKREQCQKLSFHCQEAKREEEVAGIPQSPCVHTAMTYSPTGTFLLKIFPQQHT